ncbi:MAG: archaeosortase/exosortase family protein [Steroidobacterales bacterium]
MIGRAFAFVMIFAGLQFGWQALEGSAVQHLAVDRGIVNPAAILARLITPGLNVYATGNQLREPAGGLNIVNGCDGMETLFLLVAGLAVAPLSVRGRIAGILSGIPVVYVLNQARILALFYARHSDMKLFDVLHGVVTPLCMVISITAFYYNWLRFYSASAAPST